MILHGKETKRKTVIGRYGFKYESALEREISRLFKVVSGYFLNWFRSHKHAWRRDDWSAEVDLFLKEMEEGLSGNLFASEKLNFKEYVETFVAGFFSFANGELARQLEELLGEEFYGGDIWWETVKQQWINQLSERTSNATETLISRLRNAVYKGVREDRPFAEIAKEVEEIAIGFSKKQSKQVARDMVGTLHSKVTENLHASLGIYLYLWQTQADERVRGRPEGMYPNAPVNHWKMEGKICKWSDPTVWSNDGKRWETKDEDAPFVHPGIGFGCRCLAIPNLGDENE